jgi:hypothetical protein
MFSCRGLLLSVAVGVCAPNVRAQDPFEIVIFEYEPLPLGAFTYEAHMNYVAEGPTAYSGSVAPLQGQFHLSSEVTAGLTDWMRMGLTELTAVVPGRGPEYAGFRVLPHFYAPRSWNLPLNLGFVAEFSFQRPLFFEDSRDLELRGIVEKHIGRLQMDSNFVFGHALHGPGTRDGWVFEPSGRIAWQVSPTFTPSVEYYSSLGPLHDFLPPQQQIHLLFPGADWKIGEHLTWSFGVGVGVTDATSRVILKSRFEFEFGRNHS